MREKQRCRHRHIHTEVERERTERTPRIKCRKMLFHRTTHTFVQVAITRSSIFSRSPHDGVPRVVQPCKPVPRPRDPQFLQQGACMHAKPLQSCPTLYDPMDHSLPGSSARGILQAKILKWVAMSFSRGSSRPRDQTRISYISYICRGPLPIAPPGKPKAKEARISTYRKVLINK